MSQVRIALKNAGEPHDEWDFDGFFIGFPFCPEINALRAALCPVVGSEDEERVFNAPGSFEIRHQFAEHIVYG